MELELQWICLSGAGATEEKRLLLETPVEVTVTLQVQDLQEDSNTQSSYSW